MLSLSVNAIPISKDVTPGIMDACSPLSIDLCSQMCSWYLQMAFYVQEFYPHDQRCSPNVFGCSPLVHRCSVSTDSSLCPGWSPCVYGPSPSIHRHSPCIYEWSPSAHRHSLYVQKCFLIYPQTLSHLCEALLPFLWILHLRMLFPKDFKARVVSRFTHPASWDGPLIQEGVIRKHQLLQHARLPKYTGTGQEGYSRLRLCQLILYCNSALIFWKVLSSV